ncbi:hypothetical protein HOC35_02465 [Candidatus Woesearchaeota archaeon]|nr:hypothetical protein [Candidatus Woesearchaeota archaeon]
MDKTLNEIKETEKKAQNVIENAHKKAGFIIIKAKEDNIKFIQARKKELEDERSSKLKVKKQELLDKKSDSMRNTEKIINELEEGANKNHKKAVNMIIKQFNKISENVKN